MAIDWGGAAAGATSGAALGSPFGPIGTGIGAIGGGLFGALRKKKKKNVGPEIFEREFRGERPLSLAEALTHQFTGPLLNQSQQQFLERSRGEGLVGFGPDYVGKATGRLRQTLGEERGELAKIRSAQASSQGLRGGIPLDIQRQGDEDYLDALSRGIVPIELADLEARRQDVRDYSFGQPELAQRASDIQKNRALFDLAEFEGVNLPIEEPPTSQLLPTISGISGSVLGGGFGKQPQGAGSNTGGEIARAILEALKRSQRTF